MFNPQFDFTVCRKLSFSEEEDLSCYETFGQPSDDNYQQQDIDNNYQQQQEDMKVAVYERFQSPPSPINQQDVDIFMNDFLADVNPSIDMISIVKQVSDSPLEFIKRTVANFVPSNNGIMLILEHPSIPMLELIHYAVNCQCRTVIGCKVDNDIAVIATDMNEADVDFSNIYADCQLCKSRYAPLFDCVKCNRKKLESILFRP